MKKSIEILEKITRLMNKISQTNKIPRDYGTGDILYRAEIHTIEAIKNHENVNASELSNILGITNGALTQIIVKLKKKGLIETYNTVGNKKEIYFHLTDKGLITNDGHKRHHEEAYENLDKYINSLEEEKIETISLFFDKLIESWPNK